MLKFPDDTKVKLFPPILYPNLVKNQVTLFQSDALVNVGRFFLCFISEHSTIPCQILRVIMFGDGSLTGSGSVAHRTVGCVWGIKETNASMIAFSAIIVRIILNTK